MAIKSKSAQWFNDHVSENVEDLITIGELANQSLHDIISLGLDNPRTAIAIYDKVFESICDEVVEKENEWDSFSLNVANRFQIGYTNTCSDDDEKSGNFMVYINHCQNAPIVNDCIDDEETDTIVLCTQWNAINIREQVDIMNSVASRGKKSLSELMNIKLESPEFVMPTFCIIHDQIVRYIMAKKADMNVSQYEINVAGLYTIGIEETDEAEENIYFIPSISLKLRFKSDKIATGSKDE